MTGLNIPSDKSFHFDWTYWTGLFTDAGRFFFLIRSESQLRWLYERNVCIYTLSNSLCNNIQLTSTLHPSVSAMDRNSPLKSYYLYTPLEWQNSKPTFGVILKEFQTKQPKVMWFFCVNGLQKRWKEDNSPFTVGDSIDCSNLSFEFSNSPDFNYVDVCNIYPDKVSNKTASFINGEKHEKIFFYVHWMHNTMLINICSSRILY